ncbi:signal peptidase I [Enterococcus sp. LJL99]
MEKKVSRSRKKQQQKKRTATHSKKNPYNKKTSSVKKRTSKKSISSKKKGNKKGQPSKIRLKKRKKIKRSLQKKARLKQFLLEIGISLFIMVGLFLLLQSLFFLFPKVSGYGMVGALDEGDRVFLYKRAQINRFDIVCFRQATTNQLTFRRVIGLPGEEVKYEEDELFINQQLVIERFLKQEVAKAKADDHLFTENFHLAELTNSRTLPEGSYFVLGDNRPYAADSRQYGLIEKKDIIGVVKTRIFPLHKMTQF